MTQEDSQTETEVLLAPFVLLEGTSESTRAKKLIPTKVRISNSLVSSITNSTAGLDSARRSVRTIDNGCVRSRAIKNFANLSGQGFLRERLLKEGHFSLYNAVTHYRIVDIAALEEHL
jgi:hypothetical protein